MTSQHFSTTLRRWFPKIDRAAWRRFFLALAALTLALFLALYATALQQAGRSTLGAVTALISLIVAGLVAIRVVPYLARRTALDRWMMKIEYEVTREGVFFLGIVAVIVVAALNTGNNLLFIVLSCLLASILASGVLSKIVLDGLELDIVLPEHIFAERPVAARLRLVNAKRVFGSLSITISAQRLSRMQVAQSVASVEPAILGDGIYIPHIPHHSAVSQRVEVVFPRRGRYVQEGFRISTKFPFGFLRKAHAISNRREMLVLPDVQPHREFYENLLLIGNEMESHLRGHGHDLYAIRDYQESDTVRHVDWKATAKAQQLKIREFAREDERRLSIVFDPWLPDSRQEMLVRFEKAVTLCACLAWRFYETGALIGFVTDGFEVSLAPVAEVIYPILEKLALIEPVMNGADGIQPFPFASSNGKETFQVIVTCRPENPLAARQCGPSYLISMDSL